MDSYSHIEEKLGKLAQRSMYARRARGILSPRSGRTEFQRDWERIIHSKAFRRLEDKAQIYTSSKGDHFRTRLTHTLEVMQIARGIARELCLNEDLTEAIALGHDLGHTPFGHVGERTLDDILKSDLAHINGEVSPWLGGFKHNYQSVRIVNYLEEKYGEYEGLDLTYQVMEGMLKHTKISNCMNRLNCDSCQNKCFNIDEFFCYGEKNKLHLEYSFCSTLEGQIVACADEIAQRAHDLDDGIASGIIDIEKLLKNMKANNVLYDLGQDLKKKLEDHTNYREYINEQDIRRARVVSDLISYLMKELTEDIRPKIKNYEIEFEENLKKEGKCFEEINELIIDREIIGFSGKLKSIIEELAHLTSFIVINSEEVNCFDGKSEYIIRKLYKAYFSNPRQLPTGTLTRIKREISKYTNNLVDIRSGKKKEVEKEIELYRGVNLNNEEDLLKHKIFVRSIVDLISGMTDDFANKQFKRLYLPS